MFHDPSTSQIKGAIEPKDPAILNVLVLDTLYYTVAKVNPGEYII